MYNEYFGLRKNPFSISPDPGYLYLSEMHQDGLAHLKHGVSSDGCIILLTGEVGTGKTTLCRFFLEQLEPTANVALIINPSLSTFELLATVCDEFMVKVNSNAFTTKQYLDALNASERFGPQVVSSRRFPQAARIHAPEPEGLSAPLANLLKKIGIEQLYTHQSEAIDLIINGQDVLVATPTASGKSLIYNLPVFNTIIKNPYAKALYLFPLKALAQDQVKNINLMAAQLPSYFEDRGLTGAAIYDGDTSAYWRKKIRENIPGILVTNPDMLHLGMLPYHDLWGTLFSNLTHVIIDEVHTYRGVFGSHMAWVIRRLKRICKLYGSDPVFILSSATVGNPEELGTTLTGSTVKAITNSGSPRPPRNMILLNPLDSAPYAATMLLESAVRRGLRTIVYTQSRKMTELITMWTGKRIEDMKEKIASYRAGFLPEDRRQIEQNLAEGTLLGVISTSALELGIDIGNLDICILVGYPGSMMATWQRAGRVGRGQQESLVVTDDLLEPTP